MSDAAGRMVSTSRNSIVVDVQDQVDKITIRHKGPLYKIGIGRAHKRRAVIALIDNLDIRIIDTQTGELLRQLTLDTTRTYQPQNTEKA